MTRGTLDAMAKYDALGDHLRRPGRGPRDDSRYSAAPTTAKTAASTMSSMMPTRTSAGLAAAVTPGTRMPMRAASRATVTPNTTMT